MVPETHWATTQETHYRTCTGYTQEPVITERQETVCVMDTQTVREFCPGPVVCRCYRQPGTLRFDPCTCTTHYCPGPIVQEQVQCPGHYICRQVCVPRQECRIVRECQKVCKPDCYHGAVHGLQDGAVHGHEGVPVHDLPDGAGTAVPL